MTEAEMRDLIAEYDKLSQQRDHWQRAGSPTRADEITGDMGELAGDLRDALEAVLAERDALAAKSDRLDVLLSAMAVGLDY